MDAPREVWISNPEGVERFAGFGSCVAYKTTMSQTDVRYVRADLAPSARRVPSVRESMAKAGIPFVDSGEVERLSRPGGFEDSAPTDLAPSAQPAESSARERRLAEAVVYLLGDIDEVPEEKREDEIEAIAAEARAVLASPEAPAKAWEKWIQVRQSGMFAGEWTVNLQIPGVLATVLERTNDAGRALRLAEQFAAALGLEVRR